MDVNEATQEIKEIRTKIEKEKEVLSQINVDLRKALDPLEQVIRDIRNNSAKLEDEPHDKIRGYDSKIRDIIEEITEQIAAFKIADEFRTKDGAAIKIVLRNLLVENTNYYVKYSVKKSDNGSSYCTYNYTEKEIKAFITSNEWEPAKKSTFKLHGGTIFTTVTKIKAPSKSENHYYIGLTARGNGIVFYTSYEIESALPTPDKPDVYKWRLGTARRRNRLTINLVPPKGIRLNRYNRQIGQIQIDRVVDKEQVKSVLLDYFI
jgi:hypothetical protein